jgi:adenosine deaminase
MRWVDRLPKVELHVHLEGSIPLDALWQLIQQYGGDTSVPTMSTIEERFTYRDFPHFIETWVWKNQFIRTAADFTFIAEAVARDWAAQNIRYVEAHYSPTDFSRHGISIGDITAALRTGLHRVSGIHVNLIADVVRDSSVAQAMRTLETVAELRHYGVIGIGLGGSEQNHPPEKMTTVFARARQLGMHATIHAGEAAGAQSVWGAINALKAERIGHAARATEDRSLCEFLLKRQLPLEMCPLSNIRTGVVSTFATHPIVPFIRQGMLVTVNTDDPKMFNNTLADEYTLLMEEGGMNEHDICMLIDNAITASWLSDEQKSALRSSMHAHPDWR